jgi:hypothetical protein
VLGNRAQKGITRVSEVSRPQDADLSAHTSRSRKGSPPAQLRSYVVANDGTLPGQGTCRRMGGGKAIGSHLPGSPKAVETRRCGACAA